VDAQTTPILEIGIILLAAVAAGWIARRLHLPAIVGYLAVGLGFSPFTPGYVADHEQLELPSTGSSSRPSSRPWR
jgi:predicted Kef-type K+ transport protein